MSDQPEPLSAILAEMRIDADILVFPTLTPDKLRTYADRIEAAAEREREINQKILAAANDANAILKDDRDRAIQFANAAPHPGSVSWKEMHEVYAKARAILSAVPKEGNAAALREALNRVEHLANDLRNITERDTEVRADANEIVDVCRAALAAPARNCDKYGIDDIKEMDADFGAFCQQYGAKDGENCVGCPIKHMDNLCCHSAWMLLTAEGGAKCVNGLRGEPDCRGCNEHCEDVRKRNCFYWNPDIEGGVCALTGKKSCPISCDNFHVSKEEKPGPAKGGDHA